MSGECKIQQLSEATGQIQDLIKQCFKAKEFSYSPYSKFRVGSAVLTNDNRIFTGCNVENASYGIGICAERTALVKAVSEGFRGFKAIAVCTDVAAYTGPCGACRQFIAEFGLDIEVYMCSTDHSYQLLLIKDLLPRAFTPMDLVNAEK
ncbi:predicted protein [Nematostella vectensis]|uniref:Cytidine deaminase n=1 Tax=Nematostella vectensis TaxID=45351 RepID=A7SFK0_NEMVE|nr:cytidine deaminase [Nematostella vectensis]EDO37512.1 predicted protein [Nematostella vectensis]|eukprot:XP_001629575.1 predicted protein [Nematostella vectensis]